MKPLSSYIPTSPRSFATGGVDVSQATLPDAFKCLKGDGYDFAIIRAYESVGRPDSNAPHTIYNAWEGGASPYAQMLISTSVSQNCECEQ
jgi:hypothetical protein